MLVSMQWSLNILVCYQWDAEEFSRDRLAFVYKCAQKYPRVKDDFIPQVNVVRWLKHYAAVSALEEPNTKEEDFAPSSGGEFAVKDLKYLKQLKEDEPTEVYGIKITLKRQACFRTRSGGGQKTVTAWCTWKASSWI
jgi:hypothetical protein